MIIDWHIFLQMLFLLAPAGIANTAPVWVAKIPLLKNWNAPIDGGLKYRNRRLLGANKTWRGLAAGTVVGAATGAALMLVNHTSPYIASTADIFSDQVNLILLGTLLGFFALLGDAVKSFFKRRIGVRPGRAWPPLDQIDYILGAYFIVGFLFDLTPTHYLTGLLTYALIHPVISYSAYLLKLKKDRF